MGTLFRTRKRLLPLILLLILLYISLWLLSHSISHDYYASFGPQIAVSSVSEAEKHEAVAAQERRNDKKHDLNSPLSYYLKVSRDYHTKLPLHKPASSQNFSKIAIALKTGRDVVHYRLPIQMMTFLGGATDSLVVIGDGPSVRVGNIIMNDVVSETLRNEYPFQKDSHQFHFVPPRLFEKDNMSIPVNSQLGNSVKPDTESQGWKLDAHKNLPGMRLLKQMHPNMDWYILLDDDTFVFWPNMFDLLARYEPTDPHYFGAAALFRGCDGVKDYGDGPLFAHGGSGIVISRAAMDRLEPYFHQCIMKYIPCWAGDIRTGLCLRDAGINLEKQDHFNSEPPTLHKTHWPKNPCERPITFHHALPHQFQIMHNAQVEQERTNYGRLLKHVLEFTYPGVNVFENAEFEGGNYKKIVMSMPGALQKEVVQKCRELCRAERQCIAWSLDEYACWLKDFIRKPISRSNSFSGILIENYQCDTDT